MALDEQREGAPPPGPGLGGVRPSGEFDLLVARLRARLPELENKVYAAVRQVGAEQEVTEQPDYLSGTRALCAASLAYCLNVLERRPVEGVPEAVIAQGRRAARLGVSAETLAMRLAAGKQVVLWEVEAMARERQLSLTVEQLHRFQEEVERIGAQIISAVLEEYSAERLREVSPQEQRQLEAVRAVLGGVGLAPDERALLGYELEGRRHLAVVALGERARRELVAAGARLGLEVLALNVRPGLAWGWFGASRELPVGALIEALEAGEARFALGQPQSETAGFRLSHEQARSAARVVERMRAGGAAGRSLGRCGDLRRPPGAARACAQPCRRAACAAGRAADQRQGGAGDAARLLRLRRKRSLGRQAAWG